VRSGVRMRCGSAEQWVRVRGVVLQDRQVLLHPRLIFPGLTILWLPILAHSGRPRSFQNLPLVLVISLGAKVFRVYKWPTSRIF
jgi:hypothetical protein